MNVTILLAKLILALKEQRYDDSITIVNTLINQNEEAALLAELEKQVISTNDKNIITSSFAVLDYLANIVKDSAIVKYRCLYNKENDLDKKEKILDELKSLYPEGQKREVLELELSLFLLKRDFDSSSKIMESLKNL